MRGFVVRQGSLAPGPVLALSLLLAASTVLCRAANLRWSRSGAGGSATRLALAEANGSHLGVRGTSAVTLELRNFHDVQYVVDISIGGQPIDTLFDTGSSKLVVQSTRCTKCTFPVPPYDRTRSSTYQLGGLIYDIHYGAGRAQVLKGFETIVVGDRTLEHAAFYEVQDHRIDLWNTAAYAAVAGLGRDLGKEQSLLHFLGTDEFTLCLGQGPGAAGQLTFGPAAADASLQPGDYATAKVIGDTTWETTLGSITLPGGGSESSLELCPDSSCTVLLDSGHSMIQGPMDKILELSNHINIKDDCSNLEELPNLRFSLDGAWFELPPRAYVLKVTGAPGEEDRLWRILPTAAGSAFKPNTCHPAFLMGGSGSRWVFGMPFFRYYRTTFSRRNNTFKFTGIAADCAPKAFAHNGTASLLSLRHRTALDLQPMSIDLRRVIAGSQLDD